MPSSVGSLAIHKQPRDLEIVCRPSCNLTRQDYEEFFFRQNSILVYGLPSTVTNAWIGHVILTWNEQKSNPEGKRNVKTHRLRVKNLRKQLKCVSRNKYIGCMNFQALFVGFRGFHNSNFATHFRRDSLSFRSREHMFQTYISSGFFVSLVLHTVSKHA